MVKGVKGDKYMELRQLRHFYAISKVKNFTRAAEKICISQPSITTSMQKLEDELGLKLFDRSQKQIDLTPEGRIFSQRIEGILSKLDNAVTEIQDYAELKKGSIKLGVTPMMGAYHFPEIILEFKKLYPNISLNIVEEGTNNIKKLLNENSLDMGLGIISDNDDFETYPVIRTQVFVCLSTDHPLSKKKRIAFEDLQDQSLIMLKEGFYIRELVFQHFKENNFTPNITVSTNQLETIKSFVANNIGITFLFESAIENEKKIIGKPLKNPLCVKTGLITKKGKYLSKASQAFVDFIINRHSVT